MIEPRAAIYTRISIDHGDALGVARQETACRALLDTIGGTLVGIYCDNDRSAYAGTRRPAYENLLVDVANGKVDLVIAWHADRLYRRQQDLIRFVDTVEAAKAQVATVTSGLLDLTTASGRMVARVVGAVAQHEVEQQGQRIRLKHGELARLGRWGGGPRPYGYRSTGNGDLKVVPEEAAVLREIAVRVLRGDTVNNVKKDLNRRNVPAQGGGKWGDSSLRRILTSPTICGLCVRNGAVVGPANWEPILDEATTELLTLVLANGPRLDPVRSRNGLLNPWLISCGRCGANLKSRNVGRRRVYKCCGPPGSRACGHLTILGPASDDAVRAAVLDRLKTGPRLRAPGSGVDHLIAASSPVVLDARLRQLAVNRAQGRLTEDEWQAARHPLLVSLRDARAAGRAPLQRAALDRAAQRSTDLKVHWAQLRLEDQQDLVEAVVDHITVKPGGSPGGRFDPNRLLGGTTWRR
ncbi:recombinase family protein [Salinilacustrithrix flava]|uniref:recombinase family protein n=1 Tax=Salinilacustrithrix flava TaxID=2957203 RepID=UPI003D7C1DDA